MLYFILQHLYWDSLVFPYYLTYKNKTLKSKKKGKKRPASSLFHRHGSWLLTTKNRGCQVNTPSFKFELCFIYMYVCIYFLSTICPQGSLVWGTVCAHNLSELNTIDAVRDKSCIQWENTLKPETKMLIRFLTPYALVSAVFFCLYIP